MPDLVIWKRGQAPGGAEYPRGVCGWGGCPVERWVLWSHSQGCDTTPSPSLSWDESSRERWPRGRKASWSESRTGGLCQKPPLPALRVHVARAACVSEALAASFATEK